MEAFRLAEAGWSGRILDSIDAIDPAAFRRVSAGRAFWATPPWLRCLERMPGPRRLYLCLEDGAGELLGVLPCQLVVDESALVFYNLPRLLAGGGGFGDPQRLSLPERGELEAAQARLAEHGRGLYPSLIASCPTSYCALCIDPLAPPDRQQRIAEALVALFERAADALGCQSGGLLYVYEEDARRVAGACRRPGYQRAAFGADCVLPVAWSDFDAYLGSFLSDRRIGIRRERRYFAEAGIEVRVRRGPGALTDDLIPLQVALRGKYKVGSDVEALRATYAVMRGELGDAPVVFTAERGGDLLGFILFFEHGRALCSRVAGFDYARLGNNDFCYFNLVYYEPLLWAMEHGIDRIHYGFSSYDAKLRRGCALRPAEGFLFFRGAAAEAAGGALRLLGRSEERRLASLAPLAPLAPLADTETLREDERS